MFILKKTRIINNNNELVESLAIDDFATKKRKSYGTVIIDIYNKKIINIINSRETENVTNELKKYPHVKYITRDGSYAYSKAIENAKKSIIQISDRFHLVKNIVEKCCEISSTIITGRIAVSPKENNASQVAKYLLLDRRERILLVKEKHKQGMSYIKISSLFNISLSTVKKYINMTKIEIPKSSNQLRGREHNRVLKKKKNKVELVLNLKTEGKSINEIQRITGISSSAIKKYIQPDYNPCNSHYDQDKEGILPSYKKEVIRLYLEGKTSVEISEYIKEKTNYKLTSAAIRSFILKEKD